MDISTVSSSSGQITQSISIPGPDDRVGELPVSAMVPCGVGATGDPHQPETDLGVALFGGGGAARKHQRGEGTDESKPSHGLERPSHALENGVGVADFFEHRLCVVAESRDNLFRRLDHAAVNDIERIALRVEVESVDRFRPG